MSNHQAPDPYELRSPLGGASAGESMLEGLGAQPRVGLAAQHNCFARMPSPTCVFRFILEWIFSLAPEARNVKAELQTRGQRSIRGGQAGVRGDLPREPALEPMWNLRLADALGNGPRTCDNQQRYQ